MKKKKRGSSRYFFLFFFLSALVVILFSTAKMALSNISYFATQHIEISGTTNLENSYLLNLCQDIIDRNVFSISTDEVYKKFENIIRVRSVSIHKKLPQTLQIEIEERRGIFYIKTADGLLFPIDEERIVLDNDVFYKSEISLPVISLDVSSDSIFYGEPVIDDFVEKIFTFTENVKESDEKFISKVSEFYQEQGELYVVEADKGYRIMFAEENLKKQLSRFNFVESNHNFAKNNIVDLRFTNQLIIRKEN